MEDTSEYEDLRVIYMYRLVILTIFLILNMDSFCSAQETPAPNQEIGGFSLVQYEDNGRKTWELNGRRADVLEDETVMIEELSALSFGGDTITKLKARQGSFDRDKNLVHLEENVIMKIIDGMSMRTERLDWDAKEKNVFTDAVVKIKRADFEVIGKDMFYDLKNKTASLKKDITANIEAINRDVLGMTITCDGPLELDYQKNRATFRNNVLVENAEGEIYSDRMDVYFKPNTRKARLVVARGSVRIVNGGSVTYSERAIYLVDKGKVILPKRSRLVIETTE
ncbi:MAG: LPS export ABC transporter periplasmic protein LptC [Candidatus Omnitrophota bacterium]|nr:LPS export ABC transporter periplasmic protein LptC [Candidatus Omnitrophota bacterium]